MGLFDFGENAKKKAYVKLITRTFYADYPVVPYISPDRPKDWMQKATAFPKQNIIPKNVMKPYADGLLPGHVYMLYWLKKYTNKKIPSYFEYKYGVDFEREVVFLQENGYLDGERKPTAKGESIITKHEAVIKKHSERPGTSMEEISKQMREQRNSIRKNGFKYYTVVASKKACDVCKGLDGKCFPISDFKIGVNAPPMHEGCSCSIAAAEPDGEYEAWINFLSKGGTTEEWEKLKRK